MKTSITLLAATFLCSSCAAVQPHWQQTDGSLIKRDITWMSTNGPIFALSAPISALACHFLISMVLFA